MPLKVRIVLVLAVAVSLSMTRPGVAADERPVRNVLAVFWSSPYFPGNLEIDDAIRQVLRSPRDFAVNYSAEYLESDRFAPEPTSLALRDYIRRKYQGRPIDVVFGISAVAHDFVLRYRDELFPEASIVFTRVGLPPDQMSRPALPQTGVVNGAAYGETLELALSLHPSSRRVTVLARAPDEGFLGDVRRQLDRFASRVQLVYISEGSVAGVVESIKAVAEGSLVLYLRYSQEDHGNPLLPLDVADLVAKASPVPVYVALDRYIGLGAVGGVVRRPREAGTRAAEMALRILTGTRARDIPIEATRVVPVFDARAMQRWGIGESRLPPGSIVSFRRPSLWRDYRREVLVVLGGLLVQSLLIVGLLYQRRARRQAEIESRRNLGLAADANRRVMMTALTGSIAHEISQPLGSILHNAQAAEMLVSSKRATPEVLREILSDIRTEDVRATQIIERHRTMLRKHQINKMRIDIQAVVHESLALVAHDVRARQIALEVHPLPAPCFVAGDQVLLQQVLVNLVLNAMDAMVDTLPERRRITVQYAVRPDRVEVSVRDAGTGLPAQVDGGLFEPFVTTKTSGIGIGLTIARTIVEAHDGRIEAVNNPEGGATFRVMLPCDDLTKAIRS